MTNTELSKISKDILDEVVDNGRVLETNGCLDASSLQQEVEFEANERGVDSHVIPLIVEWAIKHSETA